METTDLQLIDSLSATNPELPRLLRKHREYEAALTSMRRRHWLSSTEQCEIKRLKRMKLAGRDRIERILALHRATA